MTVRQRVWTALAVLLAGWASTLPLGVEVAMNPTLQLVNLVPILELEILLLARVDCKFFLAVAIPAILALVVSYWRLSESSDAQAGLAIIVVPYIATGVMVVAAIIAATVQAFTSRSRSTHP